MVYTRTLFAMTLPALAGKVDKHVNFTVYRVFQNDA